MKVLKLLILIISFSSICTTVNGQSTERFIRIIGNSSMEFKSNKTAVFFNLTEIQPNEYRQVRYKPVEQVYDELVAELEKNGISKSALELDRSSKFSTYKKNRGQRYKLVVDQGAMFDKVTQIEVNGAVIAEVKYLFDTPGNEAEEKMAFSAIKDAKRKAERLAKEIDKKVGKILNIEDKSSGCCRELEDGNTPIAKKTYKIHITFQLID